MDGQGEFEERNEPSPRLPLEPPILVASTTDSDRPPPVPQPRRPRTMLPLILFVLTCLSTYLAGGATYAVAVMAILAAHEMGHFLQAVRYRVPASLPFFIPMPLSITGTMGAVIVQQAGVADRKSLFDIAISGPLAGLVVTLPVIWWGVSHSHFVMLPQDQPLTIFNDPLLIRWIVTIVHGPYPAGHDIELNPLLLAGWVGILITALNLFPIGQLDGGHILYTLLKKRAHHFTRILFFVILLSVIYASVFIDGNYAGWFIMLGLLQLMGTQHPPTANDDVPLGPVRTVLGWLTLCFIFIGFTPMPISVTNPEPKPKPSRKLPANVEFVDDSRKPLFPVIRSESS